MILAVFLTVFVLVAVYSIYIRFNRMGRMIDRFPGPFAFPLFGNLLTLQIDEELLFVKIREMNSDYYPIYRTWAMHTAGVNLLHPDDIEVVMSNPKYMEKSELYKYIQPWLSTGLLISSGAKWHKRRKILTPTFHFNILSHFVATFVEQSDSFIKTLKEEGQGGPIVKNLTELIGEHTLNAICETAMGISLKKKDDVQTKYRDAVKVFGRTVPYRFLRPWFYADFLFGLSEKGHQQNKALKILHSFSENIIAERKRYHETTNRKYLRDFDKMDEDTMNGDTNDYVTGKKRRLAMLDLLISAQLEGNEIDDEGIREEVDTFTFEGHDTTAMALCFALLLFAKHKDVQERIRDEVNEVMLKKDNKLTISQLQNFSYMDRCIKESLRLYPSVPFISRRIQNDCQLKDYVIPSGAMCHIHIYEVHRNPTFWPNPLVFDPDRFLPENVKTRHPYSYIPFSAGLRNCIGQKFAMLEMKVLIAFLLHNFALEPVEELDEVRMVSDLVLRSAVPLPLKFIPLH